MATTLTDVMLVMMNFRSCFAVVLFRMRECEYFINWQRSSSYSLVNGISNVDFPLTSHMNEWMEVIVGKRLCNTLNSCSEWSGKLLTILHRVDQREIRII